METLFDECTRFRRLRIYSKFIAMRICAVASTVTLFFAEPVFFLRLYTPEIVVCLSLNQAYWVLNFATKHKHSVRLNGLTIFLYAIFTIFPYIASNNVLTNGQVGWLSGKFIADNDAAIGALYIPKSIAFSLATSIMTYKAAHKYLLLLNQKSIISLSLTIFYTTLIESIIRLEKRKYYTNPILPEKIRGAVTRQLQMHCASLTLNKLVTASINNGTTINRDNIEHYLPYLNRILLDNTILNNTMRFMVRQNSGMSLREHTEAKNSYAYTIIYGAKNILERSINNPANINIIDALLQINSELGKSMHSLAKYNIVIPVPCRIFSYQGII